MSNKGESPVTFIMPQVNGWEGLTFAGTTSTGMSQLNISIRNNSDKDVKTVIPEGVIFRGDDKYQGLITLTPTYVEVSVGSCAAVTVPTGCVNLFKKTPKLGTIFTRVEFAVGDLKRVVTSIGRWYYTNSYSYPSSQMVIWDLTDLALFRKAIERLTRERVVTEVRHVDILKARDLLKYSGVTSANLIYERIQKSIQRKKDENYKQLDIVHSKAMRRYKSYLDSVKKTRVLVCTSPQ